MNHRPSKKRKIFNNVRPDDSLFPSGNEGTVRVIHVMTNFRIETSPMTEPTTDRESRILFLGS